MTGSDTNNGNRKTLMEQQIRYPTPLVDNMKDIQNPDNIVPLWVNGGEDTVRILTDLILIKIIFNIY